MQLYCTIINQRFNQIERFHKVSCHLISIQKFISHPTLMGEPSDILGLEANREHIVFMEKKQFLRNLYPCWPVIVMILIEINHQILPSH